MSKPTTMPAETIEALRAARALIADESKFTPTAPARAASGRICTPMGSEPAQWNAIGACMRCGVPLAHMVRLSIPGEVQHAEALAALDEAIRFAEAGP